jgi:hypothetical protein
MVHHNNYFPRAKLAIAVRSTAVRSTRHRQDAADSGGIL